ncbi:hypothetical protein A9Q91_04570 [Candidatus Gracilibacteria bacterium 28_42_T64]|nr:hypothetical protein A9Q91_04570 [Candidatus Gracilibacteria bacterium 28_42_T64]
MNNIHNTVEEAKENVDPTKVEEGGTIKGKIDEIMLDAGETLECGNTSITVFPERGGHILSIKIDGIELLYQDMYSDTLFDFSKSVKGGIPYMFPNAGPLNDAQINKLGCTLPQHGIGRISAWEKLNGSGSKEFIQMFRFKDDERFPYIGEVRNSIKSGQGSVKINHEISNNGEKDIPLSTGLHPYFRVPEGKKDKIEWKFEGGDIISSQVDIWANDGTVSFNNPGYPLTILIPGLGELILEVSLEYKKFWVWSLPGKDFVCIEPVMNDVGGLADNPIMLKSGEKNLNFMNIRLNNFEE